MSKPYDYAVFIGRFQPFHQAHAQVIEHGFKIADKVIVLVGSSNRPRSLRNPFTFDERAGMILDWWVKACSPNVSLMDLTVAPLPDAAYDDAEWVEHVQHAVRNTTATHVAPRIALIGSDKDNSTFYLRLFPQWKFEAAEIVAVQGAKTNASAIRSVYFEAGDHLHEVKAWLSETTEKFLVTWRDNKTYAELMAEQARIHDYRAMYGVGPFTTVDTVVVQSGHVLLIERGDNGQLALPGGFLNADETLIQGALRELAEETGLEIAQVEVPFLLRAQHTFDDVHRDPRARIITTGFLLELPPGVLPAVNGSDDAVAAKWVPIAELRTDAMYSDHAFIIRHLLNKAK
jgi:bifunctional NMN adenylyltransferase/nudix hydrolase